MFKFNPFNGNLDDVGSGNVVGPTSATDNAIARYDGTTGKLVQNSAVTIDDDGQIISSATRSVSLAGGGSYFGAQISPVLNNAVNSNKNLFGIEVDAAFAGTSNYGSLYGFSSYVQNLSTGTVVQLGGAACYGVNENGSAVNKLYGGYFAATSSTGTITQLSGIELLTEAYGGVITRRSGLYIYQPTFSGGAACAQSHGIWLDDQASPATHTYAFWYDAPGVYRINGLGVMAYYNPSFTKYVPGAVNFERIVQQWNSDVAEFGVEVGGTGTPRGLRLIGVSLEVAALVAANQVAPTGFFNVMADANGKLYVSDTAN